MFSVNAKRLFIVCDKLLVRYFTSSKTLDIRSYVRRNPGLDNRLNAFRRDGIKIQDDDAEEFIEQSESSFYNVDEVYSEHLNETLIGKHELRHHIIKEKYFKENMPNLLTWSEKEQIRHLATTQPDEWTPEKIAESFPVTTHVVKKLLKYPWKPASEERIARHDASAMRNWRELKEGSHNIPEELRQHFLKFSDRTIPPLNRKSHKIDISQDTVGEYEQIVRKQTNNEKADREINDEIGNDQPNLAESVKLKADYKRTTLNELVAKIQSRLDHGQNVNIPDRIIVDSLTTLNEINKDLKLSTEIELPHETKQDKEVTVFKENDNEVIVGVNYPERIRIPKKAYKRGATYKMNDCFYDDDGRFLYRVIGMSNN